MSQFDDENTGYPSQPPTMRLRQGTQSTTPLGGPFGYPQQPPPMQFAPAPQRNRNRSLLYLLFGVPLALLLLLVGFLMGQSPQSNAASNGAPTSQTQHINLGGGGSPTATATSAATTINVQVQPSSQTISQGDSVNFQITTDQDADSVLVADGSNPSTATKIGDATGSGKSWKFKWDTDPTTATGQHTIDFLAAKGSNTSAGLAQATITVNAASNGGGSGGSCPDIASVAKALGVNYDAQNPYNPDDPSHSDWHKSRIYPLVGWPCDFKIVDVGSSPVTVTCPGFEATFTATGPKWGGAVTIVYCSKGDTTTSFVVYGSTVQDDEIDPNGDPCTVVLSYPGAQVIGKSCS